MIYRPKLFKGNFTRLQSCIGDDSYRVFDMGESLPEDLPHGPCNFREYKFSCASVSTTASPYTLKLVTPEGFDKFNSITIPEGAPIVIARLLRYCDSHTDPHYNADDQVIFPDEKGNIYRLFRKNTPDHFIPISEKSGMLDVANAYHLPVDMAGKIGNYKENGADWPIKFNTEKGERSF